MNRAVEDVLMSILNLNKLMKYLLLLPFALTSSIGWAQENIPVGTWRTHFDYKSANVVEEVKSKVFAAVQSGLVYYDYEDNSVNKFTKIDGLSDAVVTALRFNEASETLVVGYENGNIDVVTSSGIFNNTRLLESSIVANKRIHDVSFYKEEYNLSTDFGVVVVDVASGEVTATYRNLGEGGTEVAVYRTAFMGDEMYLATSVGVLMADRSTTLNFQDFNNWQRYSGSLVNGLDISAVAALGSKVYAASEESLFSLEDNEWVLVLDTDDETITNLKVEETLLVVTNQSIYSLNSADELIQIGTFETGISQPQDVIRTDAGEYWYADANGGLGRHFGDRVEFMVFDGPYTDIEKLKNTSAGMVALPELDKSISSLAFNAKTYDLFSEGKWQRKASQEVTGLDNFSDVIIEEDNFWLASNGNGLFNAGTEQLYTASNSTLTVHPDAGDNLLVTGLALGSQGELWVTNPGNFPIHRRDIDGAWTRFSMGGGVRNPRAMAYTPFAGLWMPLGITSGQGLAAFNPETNNYRIMTASNAGLPSNEVNDLAIDLDNEIWLATGSGVAYFPFGSFAIEDDSLAAIRPIYDGAYLFDDKMVHTLAVDGGNRKWIGTNEGAWLMEDSGGKLVQQFNTANSPLPSNRVLVIEIDNQTGEVFFLTDKGLVSYRSGAVLGGFRHGQVKIFPNPVPPGFEGEVGLRGLVNDAILKITTVSGRLVREIHAPGGGAAWNLADYNGRRVNTGVYLVFSASEDGQETFVGKIAVVE